MKKKQAHIMNYLVTFSNLATKLLSLNFWEEFTSFLGKNCLRIQNNKTTHNLFKNMILIFRVYNQKKKFLLFCAAMYMMYKFLFIKTVYNILNFKSVLKYLIH